MQSAAPRFGVSGTTVPQYAIAILHAASSQLISNFGGVPVPSTEPS